MITVFYILFVLFIVIALLFFIPTQLKMRRIKSMNSSSSVTGTCHDTMNIGFDFNGNKLVKTSFFADGCEYSKLCLTVASNLSMGKTPDEIQQIDQQKIMKEVKGLPEDHYHCAKLAAKTVRLAAESFLLNDKNERFIREDNRIKDDNQNK